MPKKETTIINMNHNLSNILKCILFFVKICVKLWLSLSKSTKVIINCGKLVSVIIMKICETRINALKKAVKCVLWCVLVVLYFVYTGIEEFYEIVIPVCITALIIKFYLVD